MRRPHPIRRHLPQTRRLGHTAPGYGACKLHGGSTPTLTKHAAELQAADKQVAALGLIRRELQLDTWKPLDAPDREAMERVIWGAASSVVTCGARRRQGKQPCRRPAGWGTSHVGFGYCKLHGGSTRNGVKHAAKLEMFHHVAGMMLSGRTLDDPATNLVLSQRWVEIQGRAASEDES